MGLPGSFEKYFLSTTKEIYCHCIGRRENFVFFMIVKFQFGLRKYVYVTTFCGYRYLTILKSEVVKTLLVCFDLIAVSWKPGFSFGYYFCGWISESICRSYMIDISWLKVVHFAFIAVFLNSVYCLRILCIMM